MSVGDFTEVTAWSPTHGKYLSYICQCAEEDGKPRFRFTGDRRRAKRFHAFAIGPITRKFREAYPGALPIECVCS